MLDLTRSPGEQTIEELLQELSEAEARLSYDETFSTYERIQRLRLLLEVAQARKTEERRKARPNVQAEHDRLRALFVSIKAERPNYTRSQFNRDHAPKYKRSQINEILSGL